MNVSFFVPIERIAVVEVMILALDERAVWQLSSGIRSWQNPIEAVTIFDTFFAVKRIGYFHILICFCGWIGNERGYAIGCGEAGDEVRLGGVIREGRFYPLRIGDFH